MAAVVAGCSPGANETALPEAAGADTATLTYTERNGLVLYSRYCVYCHGEKGDGEGMNAVNLDPKPRNFQDVQYMQTRTDQMLQAVIQRGGPAHNFSVLMPAWGLTLKEREVQYLVRYIRTFSRDESEFETTATVLKE
jgi:mono/diheme cytochrome c family protein